MLLTFFRHPLASQNNNFRSLACIKRKRKELVKSWNDKFGLKNVQRLKQIRFVILFVQILSRKKCANFIIRLHYLQKKKKKAAT